MILKTDHAAATPRPLSGNFSDVRESCLCGWRPAAKATAKKPAWAIVVGPLVPFDCIT